jgi:hypothetical protein
MTNNFLIISVILAPALTSVLVGSTLESSTQSILGTALISPILAIAGIVLISEYKADASTLKYQFELEKIDRENDVEKLKIQTNSKQELEEKRIEQGNAPATMDAVMANFFTQMIKNPEIAKDLTESTKRMQQLSENLKKN